MNWHPITEPVPADGVYLVHLAAPMLGSRIHCSRFYDGKPFTVASVFAFDAPPVTHWAPLPEPPT